MLITFVNIAFALVLGASGPTIDDKGWSVEAVSFQAGRSTQAIRERLPLLKDMGGTVYIKVDNNADDPVIIRNITIGERSIDELLRSHDASWWRQRPNPILLGSCGVVEICANASVFPPGARSVQITLQDESGQEAQAEVSLEEIDLTPGYMYREGNTLRMFVRNDEKWSTYTITGISINNASYNAEIRPSVLNPGQVAFITVPDFDAVPIREVAIIELLATDIAGSEVKVMRACTLVEPRFPIGIWQNSSDFRTHEYRQELSEARVDAPFLGLRPESYPDEFFEKYGFVPMGNPRPFVGDELEPHFEQEILDFIEKYRNSPRFIAYNSAEEPDWSKSETHYPITMTTLARTEALRKVAPRHPIAGTLCRSRRFYEFAPIFDIPIMDAYRVGAPSADRGPFRWGNYLESVAAYTQDLKLNSEPSPIWVWAQGVHTWSGRAFVDGEIGNPIPTPSEARAQLYMQLGEGAKGVFWFRYMTPDNMENTYRDDLRKMKERMAERENQGQARERRRRQLISESDQEAAFTQYRKFWADTWSAMREMNTEMCMLRPILSRGDVYPQAWVESASNRSKIYLAAIASDQAVVLFVVNLDYDFHPQGYRFKPQQGIRLGIETPVWLQSAESAWLIKGEEMTSMETQQENGKLAIELDSLQDAAIILIGNSKLADSLTPDTKSILP